MMPLQRTRDAENRVRNYLSNGPLRVQGNGYSGVFCNAWGCVSSRGYVCILLSGTAEAVKQGGTADKLNLIRPWQRLFSLPGTFCIYRFRKV